MKFKAKPKLKQEDMFRDLGNYEGDNQWLQDLMDDEGYIRGWYVDGYIVGDIVEATDEYIIHEFWCPIDKSTLAEIGEEDE